MTHDTERDEQTGRITIKPNRKEKHKNKAEKHRQSVEDTHKSVDMESVPEYIHAIIERQKEICARLTVIEEEL
jgi:hypothetical protein